MFDNADGGNNEREQNGSSKEISTTGDHTALIWTTESKAWNRYKFIPEKTAKYVLSIEPKNHRARDQRC